MPNNPTPMQIAEQLDAKQGDKALEALIDKGKIHFYDDGSKGENTKFFDALSYEIMRDPFVCTQDGRIYDRKTIIDLISKGSTVPTNNKIKLEIEHFLPYPALKEEIHAYLKEHPELDSKQIAKEIAIAIQSNDIQTIKKYLDDSTILSEILAEQIDDKGNTLLHLAIEKDNLDISTYLLQKGAVLFVPNKRNEMPYDFIHNEKILEPIIEIIGKNRFNYQAYFVMVAKKGNTDILKWLLTNTGQAIEEETITAAMTEAVKAGHLDVLEKTLRTFLEMMPWEDKHAELCALAADNGHLNIVKFFVELLEVNVDVRVEEKRLLFRAVCSGNLDLVKYLKSAGATVAFPEQLVRVAAVSGYIKLLQYFVEDWKIDVKSLDNRGLSAMDYAILNDRQFIIHYLNTECGIEKSDVNTLLCIAAKKNWIEEIKHLVENCGADVNAKDKEGRTAVYLATKHDSKAAREYLRRKGADPTICSPKGRSLFYAYAKYTEHCIESNEAVHKRIKHYNALWDSGKGVVTDSLIELFSSYSWTRNKIWNKYFSRRHFHEEAQEIIEVIKSMADYQGSTQYYKENYLYMISHFLEKKRTMLEKEFDASCDGEIMSMLGYAIEKLIALQNAEQHQAAMKNRQRPSLS